jgi:hypothetical protein
MLPAIVTFCSFAKFALVTATAVTLTVALIAAVVANL